MVRMWVLWGGTGQPHDMGTTDRERVERMKPEFALRGDRLYCEEVADDAPCFLASLGEPEE